MSEPITFWLPAPRFKWTQRRKGHEPRIKTDQHPSVKGNSPKIIMLGRGPSARPSITQSDRARAAEAALIRALSARPECPDAPWEGDVRLEVVFVYRPPEAWEPWRKAAALRGELRPTAVGYHFGDASNLAKAFDDALEGAGYVTDDAHIAIAVREKAFGPEPGFRIHLEQLAAGPKNLMEAQGATQGGLF